MTESFSPPKTDPPKTDRRVLLAEKGRILYGKYCGTEGKGICAENFALYHIRRGETFAAVDLLTYLNDRLEGLRDADPHGRLPMTQRLIERIESHLHSESPHSESE